MARQKLIHIHSSKANAKPKVVKSGETDESAIDFGEIAVNYFSGDEKLWIKNSAGNAVDICRNNYGKIQGDDGTAVAETAKDTLSIKGGTKIKTVVSVSNGADTVTINHKDTGRTNTTSTAKPSHNGSFTVIDSIESDTTGHVTKVNTKTVTLPSESDTKYSLSGSGATVTLKTTGGAASGSHTVDNVANATTATNMKISGPKITSTTAMDAFIESGKFKIGYFEGNAIPGINQNDGLVMSFPWMTSTSYGAQVAIEDSSAEPAMSIRSRKTENTWTAWKQLAFKSDIPSTRPNPFALTLKGNGTVAETYDGSPAGEVNFTGTGIAKVSAKDGNINVEVKDTNTDEKCTEAGHYNPTGKTPVDTDSQKVQGNEITVITSLSKDSNGHVTSATGAKFTIPTIPSTRPNPYSHKISQNGKEINSYDGSAHVDTDIKWWVNSSGKSVFDARMFTSTDSTDNPSGGSYLNGINIPYRKAEGNTSADYSVQIAATTSDAGQKQGVFYRNSTGSAFLDWHRVLDDQNSSVSKTGSTLKVKINDNEASISDTHYTTGFYTGDGTSKSNGVLKNPYIKIFDDSTLRNKIQLEGTGHTTVNSDASGKITISSTWPSTCNPNPHKHDASDITSGVLDIARIPKGALERCVVVENDTARFKLTTAEVQLGDTVKVTATNKMYFVKDESKLNLEAGYEVYTAGSATSVPWSGVTGKPNYYSKIIGDSGTATAETQNDTLYIVTGEDLTSTASDKNGVDKITITHDTSGVAEGSYGGTSNATATEGQTITIPYFTVDARGHLTTAGSRTVTAKDTHYTSKNIVGASSKATANASASDGSVYLNHLENNTITSYHKIDGTGITTVTSDANGNISINTPDTNTDVSCTEGGHYNPFTKKPETTAGDGLALKSVSIDSNGHITGITTTDKVSKAGTADSIVTAVGDSSGDRPVFFGYLNNNSKVVYNNQLQYNPGTDLLTVGKISCASISETPSGVVNITINKTSKSLYTKSYIDSMTIDCGEYTAQ